MSDHSEGLHNIEGHPKQEKKLEYLVSHRVLQPISATQVENTCVFVNKDVYMGNLDLQEGLKTSLGCQVSLGEQKRHPDRIVYGMEQHNRSAIFTSEANVFWHGQRFNYIDIKGTGYLSHVSVDINSIDDPRYRLRVKPKENKVVPGENRDRVTWGGASLDWNEKDKDISEKLRALGVRTIPIVAFIKLDQVLDSDGKAISIEEAKSKNIVLEEDNPALIVRAMVTPFRLKDVMHDPHETEKYGVETSQKDIDRKRNILISALLDTKNDISIPEETRKTFEEPANYIKWLAKTIGQEVAKMHKNGLAHGYLTALHNITLDARLMDLDSVLEEDEDVLKEEIDSLVSENCDTGTLRNFFEGVCFLLNLNETPEELSMLTRESYAEELKHKQIEVQRVDSIV